MVQIYDSQYSGTWTDPFGNVEEAANYALADLPHEDYPYLIGTDSGIEAIVFQGQVYYPRTDNGR